MNAPEHLTWTQEAIENDPRPADVPWQTAPAGMMTLVNSFGADTWFPENALDRLTSADDPRSEYVNVIEETIRNFRRYADAETAALDEPIELPDLSNEVYLAAEMYALADRLVKGAIHELRGAEYLSAKGHDVLTTDEAMARTGAEDETALEEMEIDLMTDDGQKWQIKSSTSEAERVEADVNILVVDGQEVRAF